jgi:hypothetical protein
MEMGIVYTLLPVGVDVSLVLGLCSLKIVYPVDGFEMVGTVIQEE